MCYLDGNLVHDVTAPVTTDFFAQAGSDEATGDIIVKAINLSDKDVTSSLKVSGLTSIGTQAAVSVLTSASLSDNNSLDQLKKIVPVMSSVEISGTEFSHKFSARSLTVMRLKTR